METHLAPHPASSSCKDRLQMAYPRAPLFVPELEVLTIQACNDPKDTITDAIINFVSHSPSLRHIELKGLARFRDIVVESTATRRTVLISVARQTRVDRHRPGSTGLRVGPAQHPAVGRLLRGRNRLLSSVPEWIPPPPLPPYEARFPCVHIDLESSFRRLCKNYSTSTPSIIKMI